MRLSAIVELNACKSPDYCQLQTRNVDLRKVHLHGTLAVDASDIDSVYDRQPERLCERSVDTAFEGAGVDQGGVKLFGQIRNDSASRPVGFVEANPYMHRRAKLHQQTCPWTLRMVPESAFDTRHA